MITLEEKILLFGALFHDIGKFEQRCTNRKVPHEELGAKLFEEFKEEIKKILDNDEDSFVKAKKLTSDHHLHNSKDNLVNLIREADHLSASERVGFDKEDDYKDKWSHKYLTSLFSKIYLNDSKDKSKRYYHQKLLTNEEYEIIIPKYETEKDIKESNAKYPENTFEEFKSQLKSVLSFYENPEDFKSLISFILILFEKYMWCIPDFTGSENTDISLYNHLKDVTGISHAIYKSKDKDDEDTNLNLIIGDIPGIQKYIFNVANKKPAKVLRGRSIFVQILSRRFATIFIDELGLTEANLIMIAGGKFYILAQNSSDFVNFYNKALSRIDDILIKDFNYQLSFSAAYNMFNYDDLKNKKITFGQIIDDASYLLLQKRNQQFSSKLFNEDLEDNFILKQKYFNPTDESDSNKIKDAVTGIPIREGFERKLADTDTLEYVDKQVLNEYEIGKQALSSNVIIEFNSDFSEILDINQINRYKGDNKTNKILINPELDELLKKENIKKDILRNAQIIEVANFSTWDEKEDHVLELGDLENYNNGAEYLTLLKGDVDNLGLIMSSGLFDEEVNFTSISRTTTLSNHLKYFFSFSLNGFLKDWENGLIKSKYDDNIDDQKVYTIFAGGDDIMLICPQSSSLKLLSAFNKTFNDFVCENPEVHISYSLTNFKHNTPIRIVADMAEDNQEKIKNNFKSNKIVSKIENDSTIFNLQKDKAGLRFYNSNLKNVKIEHIQQQQQMLIDAVSKNQITNGVIRNLLYFSEMMLRFREKENTMDLLWHPLLTYMINRKIIHKGQYPTPELELFFRNILKVNKTEKEIEDEDTLYPLICNTIYSLRK